MHARLAVRMDDPPHRENDRAALRRGIRDGSGKETSCDAGWLMTLWLTAVHHAEPSSAMACAGALVRG